MSATSAHTTSRPGIRLAPSRNGSPRDFVYSNGLPVVELCLFARTLPEFLTSGSIRRYLNALLPFATWHLGKVNSSMPTGQEARSTIREYLVEQGKCHVSAIRVGHPDHHLQVKPTSKTTIDVVALLTVLKHFYIWKLSLNSGGSTFNPMLLDSLQEQDLGTLRVLRNIRTDIYAKSATTAYLMMPNQFGENYFRPQQDPWTPEIEQKGDAPARIIDAGLANGWTNREHAIARIMFESGPRISEACSLTVRDWWKTRFLNGAASVDKGSQGKRRKTLIWSKETTRILYAYFAGERRGHSKFNLTLAATTQLLRRNAEYPVGDEPLFLTTRGASITPDHFRRHFWWPAVKAAGLAIRPHNTRHWFVSEASDRIETESGDSTRAQRDRQALVGYMAWRTRDRMLEVYDTRPKSPRFLRKINEIHETIERNDQKAVQASREQIDKPEHSQESDVYTWLVGGKPR